MVKMKITGKSCNYIIIITALPLLALYLYCSTAGGSKDSAPAVRLIVDSFKAEGVDAETARSIERMFSDGLVASKGAGYIVDRQTDGVKKSGNRVLIGRVSRLGSGFLVSVKIANAESGMVLYDNSAFVGSKGELEGKIKDITKEISKKDEIWR
jgi:hypothetical protein